jgi:hypothetical protein
MTLGITSWSHDINLWNLYVTDCNHILKQVVRSYRQPDAVGFLCKELKIHETLSLLYKVKLLKCMYVRWVRKFLQLFILKLVVLAAMLILCPDRSTNSPCDSEILLTLTSQLQCCHSRVRMSALLSVCTKEEQHPVMRFLWAKVVPGTKIHYQTFNTIWK